MSAYIQRHLTLIILLMIPIALYALSYVNIGQLYWDLTTPLMPLINLLP